MNANSLKIMVLPLEEYNRFVDFIKQVDKSKFHCLYIKKHDKLPNSSKDLIDINSVNNSLRIMHT